MIKIYLLLAFILPVWVSAQSNSPNNDCNKIFTLVDSLADIKIEKSAYEDSLRLDLKKRHASFDDGNIQLRFIVTCEGTIKEVQKIAGDIWYDAKLGKSIIALANLWKPALLNGYNVSSYTDFIVQFSNGSVTVTVTPSKTRQS